MDVDTARPVPHRFDRSIPFQRGGRQPYGKNIICKFWLAGRCNRQPCAFIHSTMSQEPSQTHSEFSKQTNFNRISSTNVPAPSANITKKNTWRNPESSVFNRLTLPTNPVMASEVNRDQGTSDKNIQDMGTTVVGSEVSTDKGVVQGLRLSMLAKLEGHTKAVSGVVHPSGSDKLFSASKDETVRVWDCQSGQCVSTVKAESEIQCLLSKGQWMFAGLRNAVKAWNFQTQTEHVLNGPNGLVHALASGDDMLFAGVEDGSILVWKSNFGPDCPEPKTALKGHNLTVLTLVVRAKRLYSGSKDSTICVWDLESLQCIEILRGHTDFVTSLLCWDQYLLSGSLDNTLKVWAESHFTWDNGCGEKAHPALLV